MARCPYCNEILEDAWIKKTGATLMGKTGGTNKARGSAVSSAAAKKRWKLERKIQELKAAQPQPRKKKKKIIT